MTAFGRALRDEQIDQLAHYVLSVAGHPMDPAKTDAGRKIFRGKEGGCHYCHTKSAKGMPSQGSANLTDAVWTFADVQGAADDAERLALVSSVIRDGIRVICRLGANASTTPRSSC